MNPKKDERNVTYVTKILRQIIYGPRLYRETKNDKNATMMR